jgi:hypothetical protein
MLRIAKDTAPGRLREATLVAVTRRSRAVPLVCEHRIGLRRSLPALRRRTTESGRESATRVGRFVAGMVLRASLVFLASSVALPAASAQFSPFAQPGSGSVTDSGGSMSGGSGQGSSISGYGSVLGDTGGALYGYSLVLKAYG